MQHKDGVSQVIEQRLAMQQGEFPRFAKAAWVCNGCTPLSAKPFMNLLFLALVPACFALNPVIGRALADALGPASLAATQ
jgi:hypothetical protein